VGCGRPSYTPSRVTIECHPGYNVASFSSHSLAWLAPHLGGHRFTLSQPFYNIRPS
jgi:hypothetical protein